MRLECDENDENWFHDFIIKCDENWGNSRYRSIWSRSWKNIEEENIISVVDIISLSRFFRKIGWKLSQRAFPSLESSWSSQFLQSFLSLSLSLFFAQMRMRKMCWTNTIHQCWFFLWTRNSTERQRLNNTADLTWTRGGENIFFSKNPKTLEFFLSGLQANLSLLWFHLNIARSSFLLRISRISFDFPRQISEVDLRRNLNLFSQEIAIFS